MRTRRTVPRPHRFNEDVEAGDIQRKWCLDCPLPETNAVHDPAAIEAAETQRQGWLGAERRRIGERPD